MNNKYIKIAKMVTGYRAYGKMALQVGSIFELVSDNETEIRFHEIGRPNCEIALTKSLYSENQFELLTFLKNEDLERLAKDINQNLAESARLSFLADENSKFINSMLDKLPKYQYKNLR